MSKFNYIDCINDHFREESCVEKPLTIDENPTIVDKILFKFKTTKSGDNCDYCCDESADDYCEDDCLDPFTFDDITIYYIERNFSNKNTYSGDDTLFHYSDAVVVFKIGPPLWVNNVLECPTEEEIAKYYRSSSSNPNLPKIVSCPNPNDQLGYKRTSKDEQDPDNLLLKKIDGKIGCFEFVWTPEGVREGDYFICWTYTPYKGAAKISNHLKFYLGSSTAINTSTLLHRTNPQKYLDLLERYTPEMFKEYISENDLTPTVLDKLNKSIAKGFNVLEDLTNQIVDLLDSNSVNEYIIYYLSNTLNLNLKSSDPTLWRRQIKEAVPLFKKKGTAESLNDAFDQAGMRLMRIRNYWQVISPFYYVDSFYLSSNQDTFELSKKLVGEEISVYVYTPESEKELSSADYNIFQEDFSTKIVLNSTPITSYIVKVEYCYKLPQNDFDKNIAEYIKKLPLMDTREQYVSEEPILPLKNWNIKLIEENDPFIDHVIKTRHPFTEDVVFGKIRTEFPYSENIYNMEEYNGCCIGSTIIITENGPKKIKDIKDDKLILTEFGFKKFEKLINQGVKETINITTSLGRRIVVTPNHKFKVFNDSGFHWKQTFELSKGDYILCKKGNNNSISKNKGIDSDLWYLAGHLYGDGTVYEKNNLRFFRWLISEKEMEIKSLIHQIIKKYNAKHQIFCLKKSIHQMHTKFKCNEDLWRISSSSRQLPLLDSIIPDYKHKGEWRKILPPSIWTSGEDQICSFLRGIFDTDGGIQKRQPLLTTKWKSLANEIQNLLLMLDITSSVTRYKVFWKGKNRKYYRVRILGKKSREIFKEKIGFNSLLKSNSLVEAVKLESVSILEADRTVIPFGNKIIRSIFPTRKRISDLNVKDRSREEKRLITLITRLKQGYQQTIPDNVVFDIYKKAEKFGIHNDEFLFLKNYVENHWFFEKVKNISKGPKEEVFDPLNVEDTTSYISNGIVSHNSIRDSKNPCDIDKDFLDTCTSCRSSNFDVDLEIQNLCDDRILEAKEILAENTPFHSMLRTINYLGGNNEYFITPLESYEILMTFKYSENNVSGGLQRWFHRSRLSNDSVSRSELSEKSFLFNADISLYNDKISLFSPDFNFNNTPEGSMIEILTPSIYSGIYSVSNPNGNFIDTSFQDYTNNSTFVFNIYKETYNFTADLIRDDYVELLEEDPQIDFLKLDIDSSNKVSIGSDTYDIKNIFKNKIILKNNNTKIDKSFNTKYSILKSDQSKVALKINTDFSYSKITYQNRTKVNKFLEIKYKNNYDLKLTFSKNGTNYSCPIVQYNRDEFYISGYFGEDSGSLPMKVLNYITKNQIGSFKYNGIKGYIAIPLPSSFVQNFEEYAIKITSENFLDNYYFISDIQTSGNTNTLSLFGDFEDFGLLKDKKQCSCAFYQYKNNTMTIQEQNRNLDTIEAEINRSNFGVVQKEIEIKCDGVANSTNENQLISMSNKNNGPAEISIQKENIFVRIENINGEEKEVNL